MRSSSVRWPLRGAGLLCLLGLSACSALYAYERSFIYYPTTRDPRVPASVLEVDDARIVISTNATDALGPEAVLYFGGNAEDVSRTVGLLGQAFLGSAIYAMHYRGYGGSTGTPTEVLLVADGLRLFDTVSQTRPRIIVIGRSLGSGIAIQIAARRTTERLVLVTPYNSIAELAAEQLGLFSVNWILADKYESWRYASQIKAPTTLIVAGDDQIIPAESSRRLATAFPPGIANVVVIPGASHNDVSARPGYLPALIGKSTR